MNFTATVSYADETRMVAIMPGAGAVMEVQETDNLGVQLYFDETSYRTMFEALEDTLRSKATAWPNCGTYCWEPRKPVSESSTPYGFPG